MHQNRSQRPRMSLLMPAMLTTTNNKTGEQQTITFMQIDCEVADTKLVHFKLNEIPMSFMKIIHHDFLSQQQQQQQQQQEQSETGF